ncbi:MAG: lipase maturation factor family protein, partial [Deltaproteobacteria bacterium]
METPQTYWLTRFLVLRLLGLVYFVAFLSLAHQVLPLIGTDGLLPAAPFLDRLAAHVGS